MLPSKYLVFDFGGTLADYENLPMAWADYYSTAFEYVSRDFNITFSQTVISQATEILKSYNARFYPRKTEISDTTVFESVNNALKIPAAPKQIAQSFYKFFQEKLVVYEETKYVLQELKQRGCKIGVLSDLPTGMPHESFLEDLAKIGFEFDLSCVKSSMSVGFRKPEPNSIFEIARKFDCSPSQICFIGDEEKDVQTIKTAGGYAILINRKNHSQNFGEDLCISSLKELL